MKKIKDLRKNLAFNVIGAIVIMLMVFSIIVSIIGYISFTNSFKKEYDETTYHMTDTATNLVDPTRIDYYLKTNGQSNDYKRSKRYLDSYCLKMNVSIVYVIKVDTSDYGRFTSVFNSVGADTPYTPWEIGYQQETTNAEYVRIYKDMYENGLTHGTVYRFSDLRGAPPHITSLVPIKAHDKVTAIMCIQRPMKEIRQVRFKFLAEILTAAVILGVFVSFLASDFIRKQIINPIRCIASEATRFANENKRGHLPEQFARIGEISDLANSVYKMETDTLRYIDDITEITAEKQRIGTELSVASQIQENSIPNVFPAFPDRTEFDIFASMTPAKEVGGDFYNYLLIDDDHLAFMIGDASGKGIPAALFMMVTNIIVSNRAQMGDKPGQILTETNNRIYEHNQADMFVTLWLGILEISTGKVTFANAGHDDAAVYRKGGEFEYFKSKHGLVVGAMPDIVYKDFEIQLNEGDKIFLYTDGVTEATNAERKMFSLDRTLLELNKMKEASPQGIIEGIKNSVNEFVGDAPQFDDLTVLCLEYKGAENAKTLKVDATEENIGAVNDFLGAFLEENNCPMKTQMQIELAIEEAYINVAKYAYGDGAGEAEVTLSLDGNELTIELKDSGTPYNPLEKQDPDITLSAEERPIGGLGVFLVKKTMNSVSYVYENGQNILTMKKVIG